MLVPAEVVGEDDEEVALAVDELGHDAHHVDVPVEAVRLQAVAPEHLQPVAQLLEVEARLLRRLRDVPHPLPHHLRQLAYYPLLCQPVLRSVAVVLLQDSVQVRQVLLVVLRLPLRAYYLVRVLELLEVLVRRQTVRLRLQKIHC